MDLHDLRPQILESQPINLHFYFSRHHLAPKNMPGALNPGGQVIDCDSISAQLIQTYDSSYWCTCIVNALANVS
jgi:hypothetical protein